VFCGTMSEDVLHRRHFVAFLHHSMILVTTTFETFTDITIGNIYKGEEVNGYVWQQTAKCHPFVFHTSSRKWPGITAGKVYSIVAFLMLQGIF
jgi:hypothetical protein